MQSIKVQTSDKGLSHWETALLAKQQRRLTRLLNELNCSHAIKKAINQVYNKKVDKDNIIPLSSHPIRVFLQYMLQDNLDFLIKNSTSQNFKEN